MKNLVASTLVLLSIAAAFTAGSAFARRQAVHFAKVGPPIIPPPTPTQHNPPLTTSQLVSALRQGHVTANSVGGPAHFDSGHLYVNSGNWMIGGGFTIDSRPTGSITLWIVGASVGSLSVCHAAKANTPFVVDFQVAPLFTNEKVAAVTNANGSSQTWTFTTPTHAIVVVYPTSNGIYSVSLTANLGSTVVTGVDVSEVTS